MRTVAYLKKDCPFHDLFPNGIPVLNMVQPGRAICEGDGEAQDVYMVDISQLDPKVFERLVLRVWEQCGAGVPFGAALREVIAAGLPLRAKHVASTSSDFRAFL
jgi:hypothetical protein